VTAYHTCDHNIVDAALKPFLQRNRYYIKTTAIVVSGLTIRRMIMTIRTLAATILALGLLAPVGAMAETNYNCSTDQTNKSDYLDCKDTVQKSTAQYGAAVVSDSVKRGPIGDFIDETPAESKQRSSN
jgi:hypothetical protein